MTRTPSKSTATDSGCLTYTTMTVDIPFTVANVNEVCCQLCPLLQTYSRPQCMRTGELIPDTHGRGYWCPLKPKEKNLIEIADEIRTDYETE